MKLEGWLEYENSHLRYWFGTREITVLLWTDGENWQGQLAFHYLDSKRRSSQYQDKRSWMTLCVISNWLYQWLIYIAKCAVSVCVLWNFFFFCNLLQNRSLKCSCPWDRHVRRLYLREDPKSHLKEDWTISFHWISQSRYFFGRFPFCKSLVCCVLCVEMQTAW